MKYSKIRYDVKVDFKQIKLPTTTDGLQFLALKKITEQDRQNDGVAFSTYDKDLARKQFESLCAKYPKRKPHISHYCFYIAHTILISLEKVFENENGDDVEWFLIEDYDNVCSYGEWCE